MLDLNRLRKEIKISIPRRPKNFSYVIKTNSKGAKPLKTLPPVYSLSVADIKKGMEKGFAVIDLREAACFGGAHIPGSINIGLSSSSPSWLGDVVEPHRHLILVSSNEGDIEKAVTMFRRAGYDSIYGYSIGITDWVLSGEEVGFLPQISIHALKNILSKYDDHALIDVRTVEEWDEGHIEGAFHVPIHDILEDGLEEYAEKDAHISIICRSGYRSNIAASFLKSKGYRHIYSVIGGMLTWQKEYEVIFD